MAREKTYFFYKSIFKSNKTGWDNFNEKRFSDGYNDKREMKTTSVGFSRNDKKSLVLERIIKWPLG